MLDALPPRGNSGDHCVSHTGERRGAGGFAAAPLDSEQRTPYFRSNVTFPPGDPGVGTEALSMRISTRYWPFPWSEGMDRMY